MTARQMRIRVALVFGVWALLNVYVGTHLAAGTAGLGRGLAWVGALALAGLPIATLIAGRRGPLRPVLGWTGFTALGLSSLLVVACGSSKPAPTPPPPPPTPTPKPVDTAHHEEPTKASEEVTPGPQKPIKNATLASIGLDPEALDRNADPCDDFYEFACGGWVAKTEIPDDKPLAMRSFVAIDDRSIAAFGQWPWPRTTLARLIGTIAQSDPAAIGIDILMPEPDRLSAERLLDQIRQLDIEITVKLSKLRNNDEELAELIAHTPSVLPLAGTNDISGGVLRAPPIFVRDVEPKSASDRRIRVPEFKGVVSSLDELDRAASGRGLVSVLPNDGIVRRIPLLFDVNGTLAPALSVELLRVAQRAGAIQLQTRAGNVDEIAVGAWRTKAERDGAVRPYYSHTDPRRFVSAVDVLDGKVDDERFRRKVVLIGVTGLGLVDYQNTPLREPMTGTEVQAQVIENLVDGISCFARNIGCSMRRRRRSRCSRFPLRSLS